MAAPPAPATPDPAVSTAKRRYRTILPATNAAILVGSVFAAWGALSGSWPEAVGGFALVVAGAGLFAYESRLSRTWVGVPASSATPPSSAPRRDPWWKRPVSYHGRWLCTSCGWREEVPTTFCPRCGKVLARLPPAPASPRENP